MVLFFLNILNLNNYFFIANSYMKAINIQPNSVYYYNLGFAYECLGKKKRPYKGLSACNYYILVLNNAMR